MANTLDSIDPAKSALLNPAGANQTPPWADNAGRQKTVVEAWNGAQYDPANDIMWLTAAGGHTDYGGNEIYSCDFTAERPAWRLVRAPTGSLTVGRGIDPNDGNEASGLYLDGRPRSVHTYNAAVHVPGVGPVLAGLPGPFRAGSPSVSRMAFFNESSGEALVTGHFSAYIGSHGVTGIGSCYDSKRHAIWMKGNGNGSMLRYAIPAGAANTGSFTPVGSSFAVAGGCSLTYLPDHDCILVGGGSTWAPGTTWHVLDCASGSVHAINMPATPLLDGGGECQPRWVPALNAACAWNNSSNTTRITRLRPPTDPRNANGWTVDTLPLSAANQVTPSTKTANGTFGRFAYSARLGGFVVTNSTSGPLYFYRL